jgi:hypothetical protein
MLKRFVTTPAASLRPRTANGHSIEAAYARLRAAIAARLSRGHAALFAEPQRDGDRIHWTTALADLPLPVDRIDASQRARAVARTEEMLRDIRAVAERMMPEAGAARDDARYLLAAAQMPPLTNLWIAGTQPVIVLWTHEPEPTPAQPRLSASVTTAYAHESNVSDELQTGTPQLVRGNGSQRLILPLSMIVFALLALAGIALFARAAIAGADETRLLARQQELEHQVAELQSHQPASCIKPSR